MKLFIQDGLVKHREHALLKQRLSVRRSVRLSSVKVVVLQEEKNMFPYF